jgi:membrane fusion protein, multidrug efflux system
MKRWARWSAAALALLVVGGLVARAIVARKAEQARAAIPMAVAAVDLAPGDVVRTARVELVRAQPVSGGLKAVDSAFVKSKIASEVQQVTVREGDAVKAGQLLLRLDTTEYAWRLRQAEDQAAAAKAQLDSAQRTLENNRALLEQGFISKNALDNSSFNTAGAEASLRAAQAAAELARKAVADAEVRAPIGGMVSQRLVQPGERVPIDARLIEIVDLSHIELEAALAPDEVAAVTVGARARLQVDGLAAAVGARVARINPAAQAGTRAVMVYLAVDPVPGLRQGLFARGTIELQRRTTLVLPLSAVRIEQARPYVLVIADGRALKREVVLGDRGEATFDGSVEPAVELREGLAAGDIVLRTTASTVGNGMAVRLAGAAAR